MNIFKIPLNSKPEQFDIDLGDTPYKMRFYFNSAMERWTFDLMDSDGNYLTQHQPLVAGSNILDLYEFLGLSGYFIAYTDGDDKADPLQDNLGNDANLYWVMNDE